MITSGRINDLIVFFLITFFACFASDQANAKCQGARGTGHYDGGWQLSDQYANLGTNKVEISGTEFTPKGTLLYDQEIRFSQLWSSLPRGEDTTMIRCDSAQDAASVFINIAGDSSYSLKDQVQSTPGFGETWPFSFPGQKPTSSVYRLMGSLPDGSWKVAKGYPNRYESTNRFAITGYEYEPVDTKDQFPYKIKVKNLPHIRYQTFRHDGNGPYRYGDGPGAYLGVTFWGYQGGQVTSDVYFAYITIPRQNIASTASCSVKDVPRQVNIPDATVSDILNGHAKWQSFSILFNCGSGALTNHILKVGLEPKGAISSSDGRLLLPDSSADAAKGIGLVYTAGDQTAGRYWIKSSGCNNRDEETNCPAAKNQGTEDGWYQISSEETKQGGTFSSNFKARLEKLPDVNGSGVKPGNVQATVNVMITIK